MTEQEKQEKAYELGRLTLPDKHIQILIEVDDFEPYQRAADLGRADSNRDISQKLLEVIAETGNVSAIKCALSRIEYKLVQEQAVQVAKATAMPYKPTQYDLDDFEDA